MLLHLLQDTDLRRQIVDTDIDDLHKEIDHHKNDQLQKQKEGKGHWKAELASQSEAAVGSILVIRFGQVGWKRV